MYETMRNSTWNTWAYNAIAFLVIKEINKIIIKSLAKELNGINSIS